VSAGPATLRAARLRLGDPLQWARAAQRRRSAAAAGPRLLVLALTLGACTPENDAPLAPPKLVFAQLTYDFGQVAQGTAVERQFALRNDGETELTILNLRSARDCTATLVGGGEIAPHAAGAVTAHFDTDLVYGPQRRTITVYSNDPTHPAVMLTLSGEVALDVAADPPQVYLGVVPPGVAVLREVALRTRADGVHIGLPEADASQLTLQLTDPTDDTAVAILGIGTARNAAPGPISTVVRVPTTSARHPVLRIAVTGIVALDAPTPLPRPTPIPQPTAAGEERSALSVQRSAPAQFE